MDKKKRIKRIKFNLSVDIWGRSVPEFPDVDKLAEFILELPTIQLLIQKAYKDS